MKKRIYAMQIQKTATIIHMKEPEQQESINLFRAINERELDETLSKNQCSFAELCGMIELFRFQIHTGTRWTRNAGTFPNGMVTAGMRPLVVCVTEKNLSNGETGHFSNEHGWDQPKADATVQAVITYLRISDIKLIAE